MSALAGLGIDNLHVDVAGPEMPIMDGSAGPFVFLLQSAGIVEQDAPKRYLRDHARRSRCSDGDKWARFDPFNGFKLDFTIDFPHPVFGSENRHVVIDFAEHSYVKEVARARTFGFMQDVEAMRAAGLALGGSLQNAIVLDEYRVLNTRGPALRQRVRQAQGARRDRRPVPARPSADRPVHGVQVRARRSTTRSRARCSRVPTRSSSTTFADGRRRAVGVPGLAARAGLTPSRRALRDPRPAAVLPRPRGDRASPALLYLYSSDRRYLRFIGKVIKFTIILLVVVLVFFFFERLRRADACDAPCASAIATPPQRTAPARS